MPRCTRIHIDGLPLHIVQRGHDRAACFFEDQDRRAYLGWLHEALARERCGMHADVLMTSQVQLLLTPHALDLRLGDLRLANNQDQPVGNDRFYREIEAMTGQCRQLRKRGRPRMQGLPPMTAGSKVIRSMSMAYLNIWLAKIIEGQTISTDWSMSSMEGAAGA